MHKNSSWVLAPSLLGTDAASRGRQAAGSGRGWSDCREFSSFRLTWVLLAMSLTQAVERRTGLKLRGTNLF